MTHMRPHLKHYGNSTIELNRSGDSDPDIRIGVEQLYNVEREMAGNDAKDRRAAQQR